MKKTGIANLPLHSGRVPKWLFGRMVKLGEVISEALVLEFGQKEFLRRFADPFWFQSLGCVIGFDWHSSGLTTTTCGALKEAINNLDLGIRFAGGKGRVSRETPEEILKNPFNLSENKVERLIYSSKMSAKVDNSLVQDGFQLYHHSFIFTEKGDWAVIQQGMDMRYARRYHWISEKVKAFVDEPQSAICSNSKKEKVLDMTSRKSKEARKVSVDIVRDNPKHLRKYFMNPQKTLQEFDGKVLTLPEGHSILNMRRINLKMLEKAYEFQPKNYEELVSLKGIGPKTIRALALISELVYGKAASWEDPVKYSFAHGGKDGIPYPVNKELMEKTTEILRNAIEDAKIKKGEKIGAIRRLNYFLSY